MAYLLALSSAALYGGAADFLGGLASRRANTLAIVVTSQGCGLTLLVLSLPLLPEATPAARDLVWGGAAGFGRWRRGDAPVSGACAIGCME